MFNDNKGYSTIVFDVFGTLVKIKEGSSLYRRLLKWLKSQGRDHEPNDAVTIMSVPFDFKQLADFFGQQIPEHLLQELNDDLFEDLENLTLYEDTLSTLNSLRDAGFKLALCSNLALPYGQKIFSMLPNLDAYALSYQVGAIKPNPRIYQSLLDQIGCAVHEVLFVGDTLLADVTGPSSFGMSARLIDRKNGQNLQDVLADLI